MTGTFCRKRTDAKSFAGRCVFQYNRPAIPESGVAARFIGQAVRQEGPMAELESLIQAAWRVRQAHFAPRSPLPFPWTRRWSA